MEILRKSIYLDYSATTPVDPRVLEAMLPYFTQSYGNPSSVHYYGQRADVALEDARLIIAKIINCNPQEIIFTSGGSESDNLALRGTSLAMRELKQANRILITPVEHHAVLRTAQQLNKMFGFFLDYLPVDKFGMVDPDDVTRMIKPDTAIVSVIYANNEVGTINPIQHIGRVCREAGVPFHTDAVQAGAYLKIDVNDLAVDLLSLGAHKFFGPKGVGILFVRKGTHIYPVQTGGNQEFSLRAGTHNIPYIVGLEKALQIAQVEINNRVEYLRPLRDMIIGRILEEIPGSRVTGHLSNRLANHTSFVFEGVDGNTLVMLLDVEGFACSSGSACKTGDPEPSEVLISMGFLPDLALGSLRVTLGTSTTQADVESFLKILPSLIQRARKITHR
jgi:cysteine desulfurase